MKGEGALLCLSMRLRRGPDIRSGRHCGRCRAFGVYSEDLEKSLTVFLRQVVTRSDYVLHYPLAAKDRWIRRRQW